MLSDEVCDACRPDALKATEAEIAAMLPEIPEWTLITEDGQQRLNRVFATKNFVLAQALANAIADYAEQVGHHPRLTIEWGCLDVTWWSHKIDGVHRNDFICAARCDDLAARTL
jgi:4a-hydroxytetrahydrobiopterin dehydratase